MTVHLQPGDVAPDFDLPAAGGGHIHLADLRPSAVVLYAYPAAETPGCTKEACDFRDNLASLTAHGYQVIGISPDPVAKLDRFAAHHSLDFPLVSDADHAVMAAYGAWGEKKLYGRTFTGVIRSTFVIDGTGHITLAQYAVKATGHVARLRRELGIDADAH